MQRSELEALARETTKNIKTEKDLSDFSRMLKKTTLETALHAELSAYLGYDHYQVSDNSNDRNGHSSKRLVTDNSQIEVDSRDRPRWLLGVQKQHEVAFLIKVIC